jgi:hypothetical protein
MTAYTAYYRSVTGLNLYAKPFPLANPWGDDDIPLTEGIGGQYSFTADSELEYCIFIRAGGSPAATDEDEATIPKNLIPVIDAIEAQTLDNKTIVLPGRDRALPQSIRGQIIVALGELITIARQVVDANGNPLNMSGRTLQFVIQGAQGVDVAAIPSASITISGANSDTYSFTVPSSASAKVGNYTYSLNDVGATKAQLASGDWIVQSRPLADA